MPNTKGSIRYLVRAPEYSLVKPYVAAVPPDDVRNREAFPLTNLQFEEHTVDFIDIRQSSSNFTLHNGGFEILDHQSQVTPINTLQDVAAYQKETEEALTAYFKAEHVICYEFKVRKSLSFDGDKLDLEDPLQFLQPAP
ncbi:hypothetical protein IL306_012887, partial [Fusarium sp. DS 682]